MAPAGDACLGPAESSGLVSTGSAGRTVTGLIFGSWPRRRGGGPGPDQPARGSPRRQSPPRHDDRYSRVPPHACDRVQHVTVTHEYTCQCVPAECACNQPLTVWTAAQTRSNDLD
jgi:hypothetical protein